MFNIATIVCILLTILLIGKKRREKLADYLGTNPYLFWLIPATPIVVYIAFIAIGNKNVFLQDLPAVILYFFLPTLIVYWSNKIKKNNFLTSFAFGLLIWLPAELDFVPIMWTSGKQPPILFSFTALFYIFLLTTFSKNIPLYCEWQLSKKDWQCVRNFFILLIVVILPLALMLDFVKFGLKKSFIEHPVKIAISQGLGIFFTTAVPEELIFRSLIQNAIIKKFSFYRGLLIAAIIFGLSHLNNTQGGFPALNWRFAILATIAGLGYGYVFMNRRSLIAAATLHTMVDFTWVIFFAGK